VTLLVGSAMVDDSRNAQQSLVQKLLEKTDLTNDQLLALLQVAKDPVEVQVELAKAKALAQTPWRSVVPWAALFTLVGGIGTAALNGGFDLQKNQNEKQTDVRLKELDYQSKVFEHLFVIDPDTLPLPRAGEDPMAKAKDERQARICLAATFGLIQIPDYVLGVSSKDQAAYSRALKEHLNRSYKCDEAELPVAFPAPTLPVQTSTVCPYSAPPLDAEAAQASSRANSPIAVMLIDLATAELNKGVHEDCNKAMIAEYFAATNWNSGVSDGIDWSAAFTAWLIERAGNPKSMTLDPLESQTWESGLAAGVGLTADQKPQPRIGDIAYFKNRSSITWKRAWPGQSGIIISVQGNSITMIGGNVRNAVGVFTKNMDDPTFVGLLRLDGI
jgi:hypothetical protein